MAKSQETFSKREKEKQRLKKQQDKQEKMKERKNNKDKTKSLSEMMVYLDEDGNLTDVPTDPSKKRIFAAEEIQISVPKSEDRPVEGPRTGVISYFNHQKGFGFINDLETQERVFVHINELSFPVKENDKVLFETGKGPQGPVALNVTAFK